MWQGFLGAYILPGERDNNESEIKYIVCIVNDNKFCREK